MIKEQLIYYSLKYQGEYGKILKAIETSETYSCIDRKDCITILDDAYPNEFMELAYPPFVLYYKGDLKLLKAQKVGIVGARKACAYATKATEILVDQLGDKVIVSGLALGIDSIAQRKAKRTIGILGSGIDYIYPRQNRDLIENCYTKQLVISEYPDMTPPLKHHFPIRNRLIAALSSRLYVMQANIKSGTMTTVAQAMDLNRDIYALPYRVFDSEGLACNMLIEEGAQMISFNC